MFLVKQLQPKYAKKPWGGASKGAAAAGAAVAGGPVAFGGGPAASAAFGGTEKTAPVNMVGATDGCFLRQAAGTERNTTVKLQMLSTT